MNRNRTQRIIALAVGAATAMAIAGPGIAQATDIGFLPMGSIGAAVPNVLVGKSTQIKAYMQFGPPSSPYQLKIRDNTAGAWLAPDCTANVSTCSKSVTQNAATTHVYSTHIVKPGTTVPVANTLLGEGVSVLWRPNLVINTSTTWGFTGEIAKLTVGYSSGSGNPIQIWDMTDPTKPAAIGTPCSAIPPPAMSCVRSVTNVFAGTHTYVATEGPAGQAPTYKSNPVKVEWIKQF